MEVLEYRPLLHLRQAPFPAALFGEYFPGEQSAQDSELTEEYFPASQDRQAVFPLLLFFPAEQLSQSVDPGYLETLPASHKTQDD